MGEPADGATVQQQERKQQLDQKQAELGPLSVPARAGGLNAYTIEKTAGKGGYAVVYKAIRKEDGRPVAIKKVEVFEMTAKKRERCLKEVHLLKSLDHPNILQMHDAFIDDNQLIIVTEWAPGGDLKRLLRKTADAGKRLDESDVWNYFAQVVGAVRACHALRIMHRDIKPANVLVGASGALKLGDLGLGRQMSSQTMDLLSKVGTPYYVSPEVVRGVKYDFKSDMWSLGCVLYELAMLRSPFEMEGANLYDVFQKISKCDYPPLPAEQHSSPLRQLVVRLLQLEPEKRPDAEETMAIAEGIVQAQASSRQDVNALSEQLYEQLLVLATEVTGGQAHSNGRKQALTQPPAAALRHLHPLLLSQPLLQRGGGGSGVQLEAQQQQQMGIVAQICAWLLRLNNKMDAAQALDGKVTPAKPSRATAAAPAVAPAAQLQSRSSSGGRRRPSARQQQAPPKSYAAVAAAPPGPPVCQDCTAAAELIKKGCQALGIATEFANTLDVAAGHGRAVCGLLQDLLAVTQRRMRVTIGAPVHQETERDDVSQQERDEDYEIRVEDLFMGAAGEADQDAYYSSEQPATAAAARDGIGSSAATSTLAAANGIVAAQVAPLAWRQEVERVLPQLSRIVVSADAQAAGGWTQRLQQLGEQEGQLRGHMGAAASLSGVGGRAKADLERLEQQERRLNSSAGGQLAVLRAVTEQLHTAQSSARQLEDDVGMKQLVAADLESRQQALRSELQDRTDTLAGGQQSKPLLDAIQRLRQELTGMDVRLGVLHHRLLAKDVHRTKQQISAAVGEEWYGELD